jgi:hypothetical protein
MCLRNQHGGAVNPHMPLADLGVKEIKKLIPPAFAQQLEYLFLCGNYGDPIVSRETVEVLEYLRAANPNLLIRMFTNGSARPASWWQRVAQAGVIVRFSIDGMEDTNHRYRIGTDWQRIMASATAFIAAGGEAEWDYLVFRHNEHQVDEAAALAKRMGFRKFYANRTARFWGDHLNVHDRQGQVVDVLWMPEQNEFRNPEAVKLHQERKDGSFQQRMNTAQISCKAVQSNSIYISAEGVVLPCCWLGQFYPPDPPWGRPQDWRSRLKRAFRPFYAGTYMEELWTLLGRLPGGMNGANGLRDARRGTREVVEGPLFQELVPESWQKPSVKEGRLEICARECGSNSPREAQYGTSRI